MAAISADLSHCVSAGTEQGLGLGARIVSRARLGSWDKTLLTRGDFTDLTFIDQDINLSSVYIGLQSQRLSALNPRPRVFLCRGRELMLSLS